MIAADKNFLKKDFAPYLVENSAITPHFQKKAPPINKRRKSKK